MTARRDVLLWSASAWAAPATNFARFPLGLYQLPQKGTRAEALRAVNDAGFDFVHAEPKREALEELARHGLKGWCTVGSDPRRIRTLVAALREHPALLFWETEDEPSYQWKKPGLPRVSARAIREAYALLKQLDPGRPVYLNHAPTNLVATLKTYDPGADIIATDIYPVIPPGIREQYALWPDRRQGDLLNPYLSQVGAYVDKMRQVAGPARPVWMVLQAFAWEMLRREPKDRDTKMVLYPNADQLLFMACQSIARGAQGLVWWGLQFTPVEVPLWDQLAAVTRLLRRLDLESPAKLPVEIEYHDTGHSLDRGIEWCTTRRHWIAVNADANPVDATIRGLPRESATLSGARPTWTGSAWRVKLAPFGTAIWRRP